MINQYCTAAAALTMGAAFLTTSCSTPAGQGAAAGAVGGAVVGGPVGAAVGAVGGAIVGHAVSEDQAARHGAAPAKGYPFAKPAGTPGYYTSPYSGGIYDLRAVPSRALVQDTQTNQLFRKP